MMDELNEVDDALYAAARKAREVAMKVKNESESWAEKLRADEILDVCKAVLD